MKKTLLSTVSLLVIFFIFVSVALPILSAEHDCSHEDCTICALLSSAEKLICLLFAIAIAEAVCSSGTVHILGALLFADLSAHSPVGMRVKLSD